MVYVWCMYGAYMGHTKMKKLKEHTYGTNIYMQLELEGKIYEVDCFFRNDVWHFKTNADGTEEREKVIEAFNLLY